MIASMSGDIANRVCSVLYSFVIFSLLIEQGLTCTAYNSSKSAVHQMCRSVAQEWGQYGIRINTLSAGVSVLPLFFFFFFFDITCS